MMKKILFGNNISQISKKLEKCFKNLKFSVTRCKNDKDIIFEQLKNDDYDALIFFAPYSNQEIRDFIQNIHVQFPVVKIYCLFYFNLEHDKTKIIDNGASKCFTTNANLNDVCFKILKDLFDKDSKISIEIIEFLVNLGFPCYMNSFFLVCLSMQRLIENPKNFTNFSKYLYPLIEKDLNTTSSWVERGIRYMSHTIHEKGIYFDCYPKDSALENKVFLQALVNEFLKSKGRNAEKDEDDKNVDVK